MNFLLFIVDAAGNSLGNINCILEISILFSRKLQPLEFRHSGMLGSRLSYIYF